MSYSSIELAALGKARRANKRLDSLGDVDGRITAAELELAAAASRLNQAEIDISQSEQDIAQAKIDIAQAEQDIIDNAYSPTKLNNDLATAFSTITGGVKLNTTNGVLAENVDNNTKVYMVPNGITATSNGAVTFAITNVSIPNPDGGTNIPAGSAYFKGQIHATSGKFTGNISAAGCTVSQGIYNDIIVTGNITATNCTIIKGTYEDITVTGTVTATNCTIINGTFRNIIVENNSTIRDCIITETCTIGPSVTFNDPVEWAGTYSTTQRISNNSASTRRFGLFSEVSNTDSIGVLGYARNKGTNPSSTIGISNINYTCGVLAVASSDTSNHPHAHGLLAYTSHTNLSNTAIYALTQSTGSHSTIIARGGSNFFYHGSGGGDVVLYLRDFNGTAAGAISTSSISSFTGQHTSYILDISTPIGDIVVDTGTLNKKNLIDCYGVVEQATTAYQKNVLGVLAAINISSMENIFMWDSLDGHFLCDVNAVGEGQVNVCGEGGDIVIGDLIVTSSIPGKGMRANDDIIRSCTVAKARESVNFSSVDEVKQIACIYLCG